LATSSATAWATAATLAAIALVLPRENKINTNKYK
jgi:hypothetical protein